MKSPLVHTIKLFLEKHWNPGRPILLGFSGGADSTALLHLVLECRQFFSVELVLAHVDHKWREESAREAEMIQLMAQKLGVSIYVETLDKAIWKKGNMESIAREKRLEFFSKVHKDQSCQALLLAHHADDHAETVLKRIFEGAAISTLGGLEQVADGEGMPIWRPLLKVPKQKILEWLNEKKISWLEDRTNEDCRYLRPRMRKHILPHLRELFGKEVRDNLCLLGERAFELKAYFKKRGAGYKEHLERGPFGIKWDLRPFIPMEKGELEFVLKEFFQQERVPLSLEQYSLMTGLLNTKTANKKISCAKSTIAVDRGVLFLMNNAIPRFDQLVTIDGQLRDQEIGDWEINCIPSQEYREATNWERAWRGEARVCLPEGVYELVPPQASRAFPRQSPIAGWWLEQRVPAFVRQCWPLVAQDGKIVHDFLTGRTASNETSITSEGIAKLQFGAKSALFVQDPDSAQIAYPQSSMSICAETGPAQKSSNLASKASFATPSSVDFFSKSFIIISLKLKNYNIYNKN